jgi:hypothetical protein
VLVSRGVLPYAKNKERTRPYDLTNHLYARRRLLLKLTSGYKLRPPDHLRGLK